MNHSQNRTTVLCLIALVISGLVIPGGIAAGGKPEVFVQMGHSSSILCIAVSPDGRHVLSGSDDKTVKLWDLATGREIWTFQGHTDGITCLAFSPDGRHAASGSRDSTVRIWDIAELRGTAAFALPNAVSDVKFVSEGRQLLTAAGDIRLWDLATGKRLKRTFWGEQWANSLSVGPGGRQVASAGASGVIIWDIATGEEVRKFGSKANSVSFSPDGRFVVSADGAVRLWDAASGKELKTFRKEDAGYQMAVYSPDGRYILSAEAANSWGESRRIFMTIWDASSGKELWSKDGITRPVAVGPDSRVAVSASGDHDLMLWDLQTGRELRPLRGQTNPVESAAFNSDGSLAATGYSSGVIKLWNVLRGRNEWSLKGHNRDVKSLAFSGDGLSLLSGGSDGTARIRDVRTGSELRKFLGHPVLSVAFSPNGSQAITACQEGLKIWNVFARPIELKGADGKAYGVEGAHVLERKFGDYSLAVAYSPDGRLAISADLAAAVRIWDAATGKELKSFKGHSKNIFSVAFSPDGRLAASGSADKTVRLWDVNTGAAAKVLSGHADTVTSVAFSPDGKQLISGSNDKTIRLWDVASGTEIRAFHGHSYGVNSVAFSPDGRQCLSGSQDGTIRLWDISSGAQIRTLSGHEGPVNSVAASRNGLLIVSGGSDGTVRLWDAAAGRETKKFIGHFEAVFSVAISPDGGYVISGGGDNIFLWNVATGQRVRDIIFWTQLWNDMAAVFTANDKYVLAGGGYSYQSVNNNNLKIWEISSGREVWTFPGHSGSVDRVAISADRTRMFSAAGFEVKVWDTSALKEVRTLKSGSPVAFSSDGLYMLSANERDYMKPGVDDYTLRLRDLATGKEIKSFPGHTAHVSAVAMSRDGRHALSGGWDSTLRLWDLASGKEAWNFASPDRISAVAFSPDGRYALAAGASGAVRLREVSTGKEVCTAMGFGDGEWVVITPEGFFNASKNGPAYINVRMGNRVFGLDQFYDVFYRPDLVEAKMSGEKIDSLASASLEEALENPPPTVEFTSIREAADLRIDVRYRVRSAGGGVGEVRLFHNGKLVQSDGFYRQAKTAPGSEGSLLANNTRAIREDLRSVEVRSRAERKPSLIDSRPKADVYEGSCLIDPVAGLNDIGLAAFNRNNTVQSILKSTNFKSDRKPEPFQVYILAIGIDEYLSARDNLKFAVKDADDISRKLAAQFATRYRKDAASYIHVKTLRNGEAVKGNIMKTVSDLSRVIRPNDVFVFFIASHGVMQSGLYSIVTHDYNGTLNERSVINSNEIMEISRNVKALAQFFILDTCHAGGLDNFISGLYDARMTVLARNMGLHMFASASSTQGAMDGYKGNGMFTHVLLEGLNNNPDVDLNRDRIVSIIELGAYAGEMTKKYSAQMGHAQTPVINDFGRDVGLYLLK